MKTKKLFFNALPLLLIGSAMVYAAAPSGGYLPGVTNDPDCAPGDTDCFVQVPVDTDDQTLSLSGTALGIEDGNSVDLSSLTSDGKFVDGTTTTDAVYTGGNVGIGTISPDQRLVVRSSLNSISKMETLGAGVTGNQFIRSNDGSGSMASQIGWDNLSNVLGDDHFYLREIDNGNGGTAEYRMTVLKGGNVGIGTTSPGRQLEVYKDAHLASEPNAQHIVRIGDPIGGNNDGYAPISLFGSNTGNWEHAYMGIDAPSGQFSLYPFSSNGSFDHFRIELESGGKITTNGNVGIGTRDPKADLDVSDVTSGYPALMLRGKNETELDIAVPSTENIQLGHHDGTVNGGITRLSISNTTGNVGIGTDSPTRLLHVSDVTAYLRLQDSDSVLNDGTHHNAIEMVDSVGDITGFVGFGTNTEIFSIQNRNDDGTIDFYAGGTDLRMRITPDGNVGIGTGNPTHRLALNDTTPSENVELNFFGRNSTSNGRQATIGINPDSEYLGFTWGASIDTPMMAIAKTGNVGIGTTSPSANLEVSSDTNGDSVLKIVSDTDNSNEGDNPRIELLQDGEGSGVTIGMDEGAGFGDNIFGIHRKYAGAEHLDGISMNMSNGNVGIGTVSPGSKLSVVGLPSGTSGAGAGLNGTSAGAVCIMSDGDMYIDTDGVCN